MWKTWRSAVAVAMGALLLNCDSPAGLDERILLELLPREYTLAAIGDTLRLSANMVRGGVAAEAKGLTVTVLDPQVVEVTPQWAIVARGPGEARIVGRLNEVVDTIRVTVQQVPVRVRLLRAGPSSSNASPNAVSDTLFAVGERLQLLAVAEDRNGNPIANSQFGWLSLQPAVATVDNQGWVSAQGPGEAGIVVNLDGVADTASIVVSQTPARASMSVLARTFNAIGDTTQLVLRVYDLNNGQIPNVAAAWRSSDSTIVRVDSIGVVTARRVGTAVVHGSYSGVRDSAVITVRQLAARVTVTPATVTILVGGSSNLRAIVRDSNGVDMDAVSVNWSSSNSGVATVAAGVVQGVSVGSSTITASHEGVSGSAFVMVAGSPAPPPPPPPPPGPAPIATLTISPTSPAVIVGGTVQLSATARDASGNVLTGRTVTWSSGNAAVATISSNGLVRGVSAGTAVITAVSEGVFATRTVTVTAAPGGTPAAVASVTVSPASASIAVSGTRQLAATLRDASGNVLSGRSVTWSTSSNAVATVNSSGVVTGVTSGSATITATSESRTGTATITVTAAPPPPPPSGNGLLFRSDWNHSLGISDLALRDGGTWASIVCWPHYGEVLRVVPGSSAGWTLTPNVLQVTNRGAQYCGQVETRSEIPQGQSFYVRMYIRVEDENQMNWHPVNMNCCGAIQAPLWAIFDPRAGVDYDAKLATPGNDYPVNMWKPRDKLRQREWYRFEYHIEFVNAAAMTARIWPRVYNLQGTLLYDAASFVSIDNNAGMSLQQFYDRGGLVRLTNLDLARRFAVGYEGNAMATDQGRRWFYAAVEIRSDTWPGPVR